MKRLLFLLLIIGMCVCSCTNYGPSREFVTGMDEFSRENFPKYEILIDGASTKQLEEALGEESGAFDGATNDDIAALKRQMKNELRAKRLNIQKQNEALAKHESGS